jgi:hypothetical protein
MNSKTHYYGGFTIRFGNVDILFDDKSYTIECGLVDANIFVDRSADYQLFVAIWINDQSPLHIGAADFIGSTFVDRLRIFEYTKNLPLDLLDMIEYQAKRFEKLKAFA